MKKTLVLLMVFVLLIGCNNKTEITRVIVETDNIYGVNYLMICEKVDGHIQSETCSWCYEDFTSAPIEYDPNYQVPLLGNPLGVRSV